MRPAVRIAAGAVVTVALLRAVAAVHAGSWPNRFAPPPASAPATASVLAAAPQKPHPAVVRVISPEGAGTSYGSGTLVDVQGDYGLVLTNWHVVADATGTIEVVFPDGFRSAARTITTDRVWDLAALAIWRPNAEPVAVSTQAPRPGEPLTIAGYGSGTYRAVTGRCTQYVAPALNQPYEMVELSVAARQGDSGGPIFNSRGELAGVLWGAGWGTTSGSYSGRVAAFVAAVMPAEGAAAQEQVASTRTPSHSAALAAADNSQFVRTEYDAPLAPLARSPAQVASQQTTASRNSIARNDGARSTRPIGASSTTTGGQAGAKLGGRSATGDPASSSVVDEIELFLAFVGGVALALHCLRLVLPSG